jgi:D-3-phosphoglycerate dehydrogenase
VTTDAHRFKVVVTDQVFPSIAIEQEILAGIGAVLEVADGTRDGVLRVAADADGLLNTYLPVDRAMLESVPNCRIVARYGIGVDNVDVGAAAERGITVTNVPDYSVEEVAAHALALMLALLRRLPAADALVRSGGWGLDGLRPIRRVSTLRFGLVGYGRIARRVAASITALGGRILVADPFVTSVGDGAELVSLDDLFARSDVVSIHAPATPDTLGMCDAVRISRMRPGAILVNTSRGPLVVLDDVVAALREGRLGGAALDVFVPEPPDVASLADVPNLLVTPHMAYYSEESIEESQRKAATQVVKVLTGAPPDYPIRP